MNKITTLGYLLKRLRDSGYRAEKVWTKFPKSDPRTWMIIIEPDSAAVFCTCFRNDSFFGDSYLELNDGGRYFPSKNYQIKTKSFEVFVDHLVRHHIYGSLKTSETNIN